MKRASPIFKLKKNFKNLDNEDYAHNMKIYFGCLNSVKSISLADFSYILTCLNAANDTSTSEHHSTENQITEETPEFGRHNLQIGEHIAGVWSDDTDASGQTLTWHIGVVEQVNNDGATVAYLVQTKNSSKSNWMFPESATTHFTPYEQIISAKLSVRYSCATIIRCQITSSVVSKINDSFESYMKTV